MNFCARLLQILFIWPKDGTGAISHNSETTTFFARALVLVNLQLLARALLLQLSRAIASNIIIRPNYAARVILRNFETAKFFAPAFALFNLQLLQGALLFEFRRAIACKIIYFAK